MKSFFYNKLITKKIMTNIITLWPDGTYSSEATKNLISEEHHYWINYSTDNIATINSVKNWAIWIVPIENKYWWRVTWIIEKIYDKRDQLEISWWTSLKINHILATNWTPLEWIESIHAHPQSLLQCKKNIDKIIWVKIVDEKSNTSHINEIKDWEWVICSASAAKKNDLTIVDYNMAPEDNETHFILLKQKDYELPNNIINEQNNFHDRVMWVLHS